MEMSLILDWSDRGFQSSKMSIHIVNITSSLYLTASYECYHKWKEYWLQYICITVSGPSTFF